MCLPFASALFLLLPPNAPHPQIPMLHLGPWKLQDAISPTPQRHRQSLDPSLASRALWSCCDVCLGWTPRLHPGSKRPLTPPYLDPSGFKEDSIRWPQPLPQQVVLSPQNPCSRSLLPCFIPDSLHSSQLKILTTWKPEGRVGDTMIPGHTAFKSFVSYAYFS